MRRRGSRSARKIPVCIGKGTGARSPNSHHNRHWACLSWKCRIYLILETPKHLPVTTTRIEEYGYVGRAGSSHACQPSVRPSGFPLGKAPEKRLFGAVKIRPKRKRTSTFPNKTINLFPNPKEKPMHIGTIASNHTQHEGVKPLAPTMSPSFENWAQPPLAQVEKEDP